MKINRKALAVSIAIPLAVGGLSALLTGGGMDTFAQVNKPPLSPPGWLFPVVWTILYTLMGIASYLIYMSDSDTKTKEKALSVYGYQLVVNFLWPVFFFSFEWYLFSFFWLLLLWVLVVWTIRLFAEIAKPAAYLLVPYLIWLTFAAYLNIGIWYLNR
ncbi:MAG: tryptophan-rich sensory protein [Lachnospiraceae bacterium]|nr:tryptophan-rich sensory protein [Lachnospiraceae bacterium]